MLVLKDGIDLDPVEPVALTALDHSHAFGDRDAHQRPSALRRLDLQERSALQDPDTGQQWLSGASAGQPLGSL